jgi:arylformamidase
MTRTLIDLSHEVEHGMVTYRGLPAPVICDYLSRVESRGRYGPDTEFQIGRIDMVANTGTYVDSPFHRFENGTDLAGLPLHRLADVPGLVIRAQGIRAISHDLFEHLELRDKALLIATGWDAHWRTDQYFEENPYLTESAAEFLADAGVAIVGIDSLNIDNTADLLRPAHTILLGAGIPIVEHLFNLSALPDSGFQFSAVPVKVRGFGSFPVRAWARV